MIIKVQTEADAAREQDILSVNECLKWDVAFRQFWAKRGEEPNTKGFLTLAFGNKGRDKKDNLGHHYYDEEADEDYVDSLTRVE